MFRIQYCVNGELNITSTERMLHFPAANIKESEKDLKALERELRIVKEERDILKKALAIFSKYPGRNTSL